MRLQTKPIFIKVILLIFWQAFPSFLRAQMNNLRFEKLEIADAPVLANIDCFYEDSRGFMWFGAYSGLFMFDGYKLTHFQNNPNDPLSISDNKISSILEDDKGNFWVGTQNGLNYFDIRKQTFIRYNDKQKFGIGIVGINAIKKDKDKQIWVSTNNGLYRIDALQNKFNLYSPQFDNISVEIFEFSANGLYVITGKGLYYKGA